MKNELLKATSEKSPRTMTILKQAVMDSEKLGKVQNRTARLSVCPPYRTATLLLLTLLLP